MIIKSYSINSYLNLGVQNFEHITKISTIRKEFFIDLNEKNINSILVFFETEEFDRMIIYTNCAYLLTLAFFLKKNKRDVQVWCNYKSLLKLPYKHVGISIKKNVILEKIVSVEGIKSTLTYTEYDLLLACANGINMNRYIKDRNITRQTYYKYRKCIMDKLNLSKSFFLGCGGQETIITRNN